MSTQSAVRPPTPVEIADRLARRVVGQEIAVRETAVALAKKLSGISTGNVLLIGSSGSGKTTLMRAVETLLEELPSHRSPVVRLHANVLGEVAEAGHPGAAVVRALMARVLERNPGADAGEVLSLASRGLVFVDEVDKIRTRLGAEVHVRGIRAQEALLTLTEGERIDVELPPALGGGGAELDTSGLLFVAAGAFEGLYDAVFDRVTIGADRGSLQPVTVMEAGRARQELPFRLRDWLRNDDLYEYGMSPQFLSRFDSKVLLDELSEEALIEILLRAPDSGYPQARRYFEAHGIELALSPAGAREVARAALRRPRMGARALREVFHLVVRDWEFDPSRVEGGVLVVDADEVEAALERA
ncbi:MAG TPA: AAA family ATPase [Thermoanaerobaculia bacterium]|nr:AAA family ATPase [Thermoanaerobaculia bacterium]